MVMRYLTAIWAQKPSEFKKLLGRDVEYIHATNGKTDWTAKGIKDVMESFKRKYFDLVNTIHVDHLNIKAGQYELTVTQNMDGKRFSYTDRSILSVTNIGGQDRITKIVMDVTKKEIPKDSSTAK